RRAAVSRMFRFMDHGMKPLTQSAESKIHELLPMVKYPIGRLTCFELETFGNKHLPFSPSIAKSSRFRPSTTRISTAERHSFQSGLTPRRLISETFPHESASHSHGHLPQQCHRPGGTCLHPWWTRARVLWGRCVHRGLRDWRSHPWDALHSTVRRRKIRSRAR